MTDQPQAPREPPHDLREQRREERWQGRQQWREYRWGQNGPWIGGTILIVLGVLFLLQNFGAPLPENWWAIFILIPAAFAFSGAWSIYVKNERKVTAGVRGALISGSILTLLAAMLFFGIDFGKYWPVILILIGVSVIGGGYVRR